MQPAPSLDTPESWGAAARGYAGHVAPHLMRAFTDEFTERLGVRSDMDVLEVGAGSGAFTEALFPHVRSLLAVDFAPKMIEVLRERMEALKADNVRYRVMDGQALDLEDNAFDAAASSFAVMLFPDRAKGFAELRRVVRPGGRVLVSGWAGPERFESFGLFMSGIRSAFPDMPPPPSPMPVFSLADPADFKAQMEAAGFRDVETGYTARDLEVENFDRMWDMLTVGTPPVQALFDRIGPEGAERLREHLGTIVEERFGSGPIRTTNAATVGIGTAP